MTEHLPECMTSVVRMNYDCICPELRACEQRVLDAARKALRNECFHETESEWCVFVAAINALKEKP